MDTEKPTGEWLKEFPKQDGIYWTYAPPPDAPKLVRIKYGYQHFLGTEDIEDEPLEYQLFWSEPLVPPPIPATVARRRQG